MYLVSPQNSPLTYLHKGSSTHPCWDWKQESLCPDWSSEVTEVIKCGRKRNRFKVFQATETKSVFVLI